MYRALFTADVHISNTLPYAKRYGGDAVSDRLRDTLAVLMQMAEYAEEHSIDTLWFIGDLLDRRLLDAVTIKHTMATLLHIVDKYHLRIEMVPGNHESVDAVGSAYTLEVFANVRPSRMQVWAEGPHQWTKGDLRFCGLPYKPDHLIREALAKASQLEKDETILLLHQNLVGGRVGDWVCPDGVRAEDLEPFKFTLAGHFHTHQELTRAMYLGAPLQHNFGDVGEVRGFWDITFTDDGAVKTELVPSRTPKFYVFRGLDAIDIEDVEDSYIQIDLVGTTNEITSMSPEASYCAQQLQTKGARLVKVRPLVLAEKRSRLNLHSSEGKLTWPAAVAGYLDACSLEGLERKRLEEIACETLHEAELNRG